MTAKERAEACLTLATKKADNDSMFLPCDLEERIVLTIQAAERVAYERGREYARNQIIGAIDCLSYTTPELEAFRKLLREMNAKDTEPPADLPKPDCTTT